MKPLTEFFVGFLDGFKDFSLLIGNIINYILLSFIYFFGVGLTFIFAKLVGKHFLELKPDSERTTYWIDRKAMKQSLEDSKKQF